MPRIIERTGRPTGIANACVLAEVKAGTLECVRILRCEVGPTDDTIDALSCRIERAETSACANAMTEGNTEGGDGTFQGEAKYGPAGSPDDDAEEFGAAPFSLQNGYVYEPDAYGPMASPGKWLRVVLTKDPASTFDGVVNLRLEVTGG